MQFVNLTPHSIVLRSSNGTDTSIPASGNVARVSTLPSKEEEVAGIPVGVIGLPKFGEVVGLPAPEAGVVYLVSGLVAQNAGRRDVMAPATGPQDGAIRDEAGRVVAVTKLVRSA